MLAPIAFLFGSQDAARKLARWRWTLLLGLILVASAGIARRYDVEGGLSGGWWFLGPLLVSLFSASLIYCLSVLPLLKFDKRIDARPGRSFLIFLGLFWLTAPCAWLYALPVEKWTDTPLVAAQINVALLAVVASWRVWIIARACQAVTGQGSLRCLLAVLWPAALELALVSYAASFLNHSLAASMGGVREVPPEDVFMLAVYDLSTVGGLLTGVTAGVALKLMRKAEEPPSKDQDES